MQFFKSILVLTLATYVTASALPEPLASCSGFCDPTGGVFCGSGCTCNVISSNVSGTLYQNPKLAMLTQSAVDSACLTARALTEEQGHEEFGLVHILSLFTVGSSYFTGFLAELRYWEHDFVRQLQ